MRLTSLTVSGFRGFADEVTFDLAADVVLLHGPNGSGKTSFFDALLWALVGSVDRVGPEKELVSRYSDFGEARVEVELLTGDGRPLRVLRRFDGERHLAVEIGDHMTSGTSAEALLLDSLWPEAKAAPKPWESLGRAMTRAVYLQQDQVRSFVESEDEQGRFDVVGEIIGAGRVGELIRQLETSRKAWTTATNRVKEEASPLAKRRTTVLARLEELSHQAIAATDIEDMWSAWVAAVQSASDIDSAPSDGPDRSRVVERVLEGLRISQRSADARIARLQELRDLLDREPTIPAGLDDSKGRREQAEAEVTTLGQSLVAAEARAASIRREQTRRAQGRESLAALAQLALPYVDGPCPVCTQEHDRSVTVQHLQNLIESSGEVVEDSRAEVESIAEQLSQAESTLAAAQADERRLQRAEQEVRHWNDGLIRLATEAQFPETGPSALRPLVAAALEAAIAQLEGLQSVRSQGERLALALARTAEAAEVSGLEAQLAQIEAELSEREQRIALRELAGDDARALHEALRRLGESLVVTELERIEPVLQKIYASIDPHPSFRAVRLLTRMHRGRGRLWTSLEDTANDLTVEEPRTVLSSSQLNVLAVVTFLSLNLCVPTLPLSMAALDDPLQSLDNVNLLGLADLLRRLRRTRQVLISTHDERLAGLLERKLRPVGELERTTVIRVDAWSTRGPAVTQRDVLRDDGNLRLVASA